MAMHRAAIKSKLMRLDTSIPRGNTTFEVNREFNKLSRQVKRARDLKAKRVHDV